MAYKTEELLNQSITAIKKHKLFFIEDVVSFLPCSKPTFYEHKLNESNELKELIEQNKVNVKVAIRKKWEVSDNFSAQMALYKLIGTNEERKNLAMEYRDHTTDGEKIEINIVRKS